MFIILKMLIFDHLHAIGSRFQSDDQLHHKTCWRMDLTPFKQFGRRNMFKCDKKTSPTFPMARDLSGKQGDHPAGKVLTIKQATPCTTVKRQKLQKSMSRLEALVEAKTQGANSMIHWSWGGIMMTTKKGSVERIRKGGQVSKIQVWS